MSTKHKKKSGKRKNHSGMSSQIKLVRPPAWPAKEKIVNGIYKVRIVTKVMQAKSRVVRTIEIRELINRV